VTYLRQARRGETVEVAGPAVDAFGQFRGAMIEAGLPPVGSITSPVFRHAPYEVWVGLAPEARSEVGNATAWLRERPVATRSQLGQAEAALRTAVETTPLG